MDVTSRVIRIHRRLADIEYQLDCNDMSPMKREELLDEQESLESEWDSLDPATHDGATT